ncbi:VOC family protein [Ekhidna sp.]
METFKIRKMTIAATDITKMVTFYNEVFESNLSQLKLDNFTLYAGKLGEIDLLICPNELAKVDAKKNRQQFEFFVEDLFVIESKAIQTGGQVMQKVDKSMTIIDPDGNTIIFTSY